MIELNVCIGSSCHVNGAHTVATSFQHLIEEYYRIAPGIVTAMNLTQPDVLYPALWKNFLTPCYEALLRGDNAGCKRLYVRMVRTLSKKYS